MSKAAYQKLKDGYYGIGGFDDGSYLIQHPRETDKKYGKRKEAAYYLNYVSSVVDGHVNPIFRSPISRDWKGSGLQEIFEKFSLDVDCLGTNLDSFMKMAALASKLYGIVFLVVDNFQEVPQTKDKTIEERAFPYLYLVEPSAVTEYKLDRLGRLIAFSFEEKAEDGESTQTRTFTAEKWQIDNGEEGDNHLGVVPVIPLLSRKIKLGEELPPSEFAAIVKTNLNIFQQCSWLNEILQNQTFPLLVYPSNEAVDLTIGSENALGFDGETSHHAPSFIAPPSGPAEVLAANVDRLIKEIYRMAQMSHTTGVEKQTSGVARAWDFEESNLALSDFAENLENAEKQITFLFSRYMNDATFEYLCSYSRNFQVPDLEKELSIAQSALDLGFGALFDAEVLKKILATLFPDLDSKTYDAIVQVYAKALEDQTESKRADHQEGDPPEDDG